MHFYECVFISRHEISSAQILTYINEISEKVASHGGKIEYQEDWGLRHFAYRINKARKGHYNLLRFSAPNAALKDLKNYFYLNQDIIRNLTVRIEEDQVHTPSPILSEKNERAERSERSSDRRDRSDRGDRPTDRSERSEPSTQRA